jgi:hypothetical protein
MDGTSVSRHPFVDLQAGYVLRSIDLFNKKTVNHRLT